MEKQVHKVKKAIILTKVDINQVPYVLEHQGYQVHPQTRTNQIFYIICLTDIKVTLSKALLNEFYHYRCTNDQERKPIKIPTLILPIILAIVLYLQLNR